MSINVGKGDTPPLAESGEKNAQQNVVREWVCRVVVKLCRYTYGICI